MRVVFLLLHLLARDEQIRAVRGDDVVAAIGGGVPDGLVLAHEQYGDARSEAAERRGGGGRERGMVPEAVVGVASLERVSCGEASEGNKGATKRDCEMRRWLMEETDLAHYLRHFRRTATAASILQASLDKT